MAMRNRNSIGEDDPEDESAEANFNGREFLDLPFSQDSDVISESHVRAPPMEVQFMDIDEQARLANGDQNAAHNSMGELSLSMGNRRRQNGINSHSSRHRF